MSASINLADVSVDDLRVEILRRTRPVPTLPRPLVTADWEPLRLRLVQAVEDGWQDQFIEGNLALQTLSMALRAIYGTSSYEDIRERFGA